VLNSSRHAAVVRMRGVSGAAKQRYPLLVAGLKEIG
jgi:hypothetical protein